LHELDPLLAHYVESIDALNPHQSAGLLNQISGIGGGHTAILMEVDALSVAAPPANPSNPYSMVFVLPIKKGLQREQGNYYDATRRWWNVRKDRHNTPGALAVGLIGGISHIVYSIEKWQPSEA
jgi:hypothetical protein